MQEKDVELFVVIAMLSPLNEGPGLKLTAEGRAYARKTLEEVTAETEMVLMTTNIPEVLKAAEWSSKFYKLAYQILENLDRPYKDSEELAIFDREFMEHLMKNPVMLKVLKDLILIGNE
jgi:hypothetical protein